MPVDSFVVVPHDRGDTRIAEHRYKPRSFVGVALDRGELLLGQRPRLVEDRARNRQLADIVGRRPRTKPGEFSPASTRSATFRV